MTNTAFQKLMTTLPPELAGEQTQYLQELSQELLDTNNIPESWRNLWPESVLRVTAASPFIAQMLIRNPGILTDLVANGSLFECLSPAEMEKSINGFLAAAHDEPSMVAALRKIRYQYSLLIAWRDLAGWAGLDETLTTLSALADLLVKATLDKSLQWEAQVYGHPVGEETDRPASLCIYALGKLGGNELNFSSDIDLIFLYTEDGETSGANKKISNYEFFSRVAKKIIKLLSEQTKDGFVFRVDMRLRPNGKSGPLVLSFNAAEHYYVTHGREWERYAWIKARLMAGDEKSGHQFLNMMRPFIYRKYLDYGAIEAIRSLKESINQELRIKNINNDIKRGPGGIREIEFIGQVFQLIRGGREPALQQRSILNVLKELSTRSYITPRAVTELSLAYDFLRRTEHRLQMVGEQQTHTLPTESSGQARLAFAMGFPDWVSFKKKLDQHMGHVHNQFELIIAAPQIEKSQEQDTPLVSVWSGRLERKEALAILKSHGYTEDAGLVLDLLEGVHSGSTYSTFSSKGKERFDRLVPLLVAAAGIGNQPEKTISRLMNVLEAIGQRSAYLALLVENPLVLSQLVKLCSASPWIAEWISLHPLLLDELINPVSVFSPPSKAELAVELARQLDQHDGSDLERLMEILREFCNRYVLHLAAAEVGPGIEPDLLSRQLSNIADVLIDASLKISLSAMEEKYGAPRCMSGTRGFVVIGYGKLGGHELGFGSDVDIIFLHNNCGEGETSGPRTIANETFFARVSKRLIHILTTRTHGGILYEVDARLRPSGKSGPIVTGLDAFVKYQMERAWTWESQALVRARPVAGDNELADLFVTARKQILCQQRDHDKLRAEVSEMRAKMLEANKSADSEGFDIKHDRGGIVDVEFMVQYWVLAWAHDCPKLTEHTENCAILRELASEALIREELAEVLIGAYQQYLSAVYHLKLMQAVPRVAGAALDALGKYPEQVTNIWNEVMER